ncbi:MAG: glutamate synthase-related protein [Chloroflexota bacterium]|nr:glutamate synthase-related protein [Chloroflexota bacterium]
MSTSYHIHTAPAPAPFTYPAKFRLGEGDDYVKYGHAALPEGRRGGDPHWTAQIITQTWYQAETGRIPISGAGYGGPFAGPGFDSMWLDMSEIVRPTRDGIHGREYISTTVDLGRRLSHLEFDARGQLVSTLPPLLEIPIPVLFNPVPMPIPGRGAHLAVARAAAELGTFALVPPSDWDDDLAPYAGSIAPLLMPDDDFHAAWVGSARLVEIEAGNHEEALALREQVKEVAPQAIVSFRLPFTPTGPQLVEDLVRAGAELIHLYADDVGHENGSARFLTTALRNVHEHLVEAGVRDAVTLMVSGGIATAEHVPKAIACGADAVAVDFALVVALGCALWADVRHPCPVEQGEIDPQWGAQRIVNLMAAWRDQLLEVLGAMGMREVRRMRGEMGRAIFYEEEEREFRGLCTVAKIPMTNDQIPNEGEAEGDLRWPTELILATAEQARTGRPPTSGLEYRVGKSGGGFDRLRFAFELDENSRITPYVSSFTDVDLSLDLNRRHDNRPCLRIPHPWYGAGMSFGSVSLNTMLARARAAQMWDSFTSTGEGGYPDELIPYAEHIITQVATGLFGVREETIQRARIVEFKYAQGAKPGLGGHLLGSKVTPAVAAMREAVVGCSLFSPFPFHSVYSVEDHKKHVDWVEAINPQAIISVKVSTPTDVDMVAVGSYYAGAHIIHLDGTYGGTGAAPEIAKKNIAMPIEYAISKVHHFLEAEGIRDEIVVMASGGVRTAYDVAKSIALGADGCIVGTADIVALGCMRLGTCEKDQGCPFGITTTDPELSKLIDPEEGSRRIAKLYASWRIQLADILHRLGLRSARELRGRTDLLVYLE